MPRNDYDCGGDDELITEELRNLYNPDDEGEVLPSETADED